VVGDRLGGPVGVALAQRRKDALVLAYHLVVVGPGLADLVLGLPVDVPEQVDELQGEGVAERFVEQFVEAAVVAGAADVAAVGRGGRQSR
jgi:hypothetical protein